MRKRGQSLVAEMRVPIVIPVPISLDDTIFNILAEVAAREGHKTAIDDGDRYLVECDSIIGEILLERPDTLVAKNRTALKRRAGAAI